MNRRSQLGLGALALSMVMTAAACAPGSGNGPAECAWADGDTFGVVVSAGMNPAALADEMRLMRSQIEHVVR